jgi:hypothetical protein
MSFRIKWSLAPTVAASLGMVTGNIAGGTSAWAQTAPPPAEAATAAGAPPSRVGWLSQISGSVSFHGAGQTQWVAATQNFPVATGDAVWTQPQAGASIIVDSSRFALAGGTEMTAQEIDDTTVTAALSQGEVFLNLVALQPGQSVTIQTPRGTAQIAGNGEYEIFAGDSATPTYVTAITGSIAFTGLGATGPQTVAAQQTLVISGTNPVQAQLGAMQQDQFLTTMLQQITPPPPPTATAAPPVVARMTGATVLTQYGNWQPQPQYGTVWFPHVASGWVPYREGHWAYVQPWGWTWVDNAPWGFAPFHYGRWSQFNGQWGWIPQPVAQQGYGQGYGYGYQYDQNRGYYAEPGYRGPAPAYAPALVTFLGAAAGAAIGAFAANALSSGNIGWAPLGPREAYYPPYRVNERQFQAYNQPYVPNYTQFVQRNVTFNDNRVVYRNDVIVEGNKVQFANRGGATFVPAAVMMNSRPVREAVQAAPQGDLRPFRPVAGQALPRPTAETAGITPALAERMHLAAQQGGAVRPAAPGPEIRPMPTGARPFAPALVPHAQLEPTFRQGSPRPGVAPIGQPGAPARAEAIPGQPVRPAAGALPPLATVGGVGARPAGVKPEFRPVPPGAAPGAVAAPRVEAPRVEAPRPAPALAPAARVEAPRPAPALAPAARVEAPRPAPAPRVEAPRPAPAPRAEAPRLAPAPRVEAPRPAPAPRVEVPRPAPAPRVEAPRPAPAPRVEAPRPAPAPAPHAEEHPPEKKKP